MDIQRRGVFDFKYSILPSVQWEPDALPTRNSNHELLYSKLVHCGLPSRHRQVCRSASKLGSAADILGVVEDGSAVTGSRLKVTLEITKGTINNCVRSSSLLPKKKRREVHDHLFH